jgi:TorA maturation chaperone TorD
MTAVAPAPVDVVQVAPWYLFAAEALRSSDPVHLGEWIDDLTACPAPAGVPEAAVWRDALISDPRPQALEVEYVRLFLHPAGAVCPPWQSVHSDEPSLMGESHQQAMNWFQRLSLAPPSESEPADHAGLLLGFYALLLDQENEADAREFAAMHLAWLPAFGIKLRGQSRHPFYQLLGTLVERLGSLAVSTCATHP